MKAGEKANRKSDAKRSASRIRRAVTESSRKQIYSKEVLPLRDFILGSLSNTLRIL